MVVDTLLGLFRYYMYCTVWCPIFTLFMLEQPCRYYTLTRCGEPSHRDSSYLPPTVLTWQLRRPYFQQLRVLDGPRSRSLSTGVRQCCCSVRTQLPASPAPSTQRDSKLATPRQHPDYPPNMALSSHDVSNLRAALQDAVVRCSERCLYQSSKW